MKEIKKSFKEQVEEKSIEVGSKVKIDLGWLKGVGTVELVDFNEEKIFLKDTEYDTKYGYMNHYVPKPSATFQPIQLNLDTDEQ